MGIPLCCNICTFVPMNEEQKISVVINTYNAEKHLRKVLDSLKDFDEVLICDMESTDSTLSIASDYACRTITFPKGVHSIVEPAREYAIHEAKYPWVLVVDADEVVSAELRTYLYQHIASSAPAEGIRIPRKNYFMGRFMHAAYPDYVLRFFRKDLTSWPAIIHASPIVQGRIQKIPPHCKHLAFEHLANDSLSDLLRKTNNYSSYEIEKRRHKSYGIGSLLARPLVRFIRQYFFKGGFRDGVPGFIHAVHEAYYQFILVAKIIEARNLMN